MNKKYLYIGLVVVAFVGAGIFYFTTKEPVFVPSPAPPIVELKNGDTYDLVAGPLEKEINGERYKMFAYNGSVPGPVIKVLQGSEVTINFKNNIDMKGLLHSHGVRMDSLFDGSPSVQKEMEPGETFAYRLKFPDAGVYWYHPHVREDYQQEMGMYGNYLVVPSQTDYWSPVNREIPLFLDDILIENGILLSKTRVDRTLMGRFGNVMLVNGEVDYRILANQGEVVRFYITNASSTRPFNFAISGAKMKLVGGDNGAYEREKMVDSVLLGPSERSVIDVFFGEAGVYAMENRTPGKTYSLGVINVSEQAILTSYEKEFTELKTHKETVESIDPFRPYFERTPDKQIKLSIEMGGEMLSMPDMGHMDHSMPDGSMMGGSMTSSTEGGIEWEDTNRMMNQMSDAEDIKWKIIDQATGKENMDIKWSLKRGEPVKIRIFNDPKSMHPMQHPIHFHGQRFLVLSRDGVKERNLIWKDTTFIPSGSTVDILLDASNPGMWMAHCHISEHLEAGMMFEFEVL